MRILVPEPNASLFRQAAMDLRESDIHASGMLHEAARLMESESRHAILLPRWFTSGLLDMAVAATKNKAAKRHMRQWAVFRRAIERDDAERRAAESAGRTMRYEQYRVVRDNPSLKDRLHHSPDTADVFWLAKDDAAVRAALYAAPPKPVKRPPVYYETRF